MDDENEENLFGIVAITAYNDGTYTIRTSMDYGETLQLVYDAMRDLEDGTLEGIGDFDYPDKQVH